MRRGTELAEWRRRQGVGGDRRGGDRISANESIATCKRLSHTVPCATVKQSLYLSRAFNKRKYLNGKKKKKYKTPRTKYNKS